MLTDEKTTCFSGGADGADKLFGELADKVGHDVMHFSFKEHKSKCDRRLIRILDQPLLDTADEHIKAANKILKRGTGHNLYVRNLLRRNYFQIAFTQCVYAITNIDIETTLPLGGTAWAVAMAINAHKDIFVFDTDTGWQQYVTISQANRITWQPATPYIPIGKYTGIGTRDLNEKQRKAIVSLYE